MDLVKLSKIIRDCALQLITVEDWILIQRSSFDLHIDDQPYHSIQVYVKMTTRSYVVRVWGKSVKIGHLATTDELEELCTTFFQKSAVCVGYLGSPPKEANGDELVQVHYPYTRWISESCKTTYAKSRDKAGLIVGLCPSCSTEENVKAERAENREADNEFSSDNDWREPEFDSSSAPAVRVKKEAVDDADFNFASQSSRRKAPQVAMKQESKPKIARKHPCEKCPYVAVSLTSLYNHVKIVHDNIRDYVCKDCGFKSGTSHGLIAHTKSVHLKIRDYVCDDCGKAFATKSQLKTHKKSIHLKIKDNVCQQCGYSCSEPASLRIHIKAVHQKIKDVVCDDCGAAFSRTMTLTRHKKSVHSNIRNHVCKECSSAFKQVDALKQHVKTVHRHIKDYVCSKCSKAFTQKKHLKRHEINIHHIQPT